MTKITRTDEVEKYNITVDWLDNFAKNLPKIANVAPPPPPGVFHRNEKFATIEDKMKDIMSRVGFETFTNIKEGSEETNSKTASKECSCGKGASCICDKVRKVDEIKKFISDMLSSEPHLDQLNVIQRCRDNFSDMDQLKIDLDKLKRFVASIKSKIPSAREPIVYKQLEVDPMQGDDIADYYNHAMPIQK